MTDQVTDTKSGTQSGLFTDCLQIAFIGLKFDNRIDPLGCLGQASAPQTLGWILIM